MNKSTMLNPSSTGNRIIPNDQSTTIIIRKNAQKPFRRYGSVMTHGRKQENGQIAVN